MTRIDLFEPRTAALVIAAVSALALIGAYLFQYVGGLPPCMLCLWQRPPYYIAAFAAVGALLLLWRAPHLDTIILIFMSIAGLALIVNAGLGVYHAGVEWKWWPGPDVCESFGLGEPKTAKELLEQLENNKPVRCDEASWRFIGLSLAGYSALISTALATISAMSVMKASRGVRS
jgi:disulfide bond formation protein DsbB